MITTLFKIFVSSHVRSGLPHNDSHSNDDMEVKPVNPIDGLEVRSQSSLSEDLPIDASSTPTPPNVRNTGLSIPETGSMASLGGNLFLSFCFPLNNIFPMGFQLLLFFYFYFSTHYTIDII